MTDMPKALKEFLEDRVKDKLCAIMGQSHNEKKISCCQQ